MNKRIKELIRQSGGISHDDDGQELSPMLVGSNVEKFAELIIQKCADVAKYHTPDTEECEHTWLVHDKIKEHFGVE